MGLMQKGIETYDAMEHLVGVPEEGKQPLAPIAHIIANVGIEITIDADGSFVSARQINEKAIIPCTEDSSSRSGSKIAPHPLCDQLGYVSGSDIEKYKAYSSLLSKWIDSGCNNPMIVAVFTYVKKQSIMKDLQKAGLKKISEKDVVIWRVVGLGNHSGSVCESTSLHHDYVQFYIECLAKDDRKTDYCMATGENTITTSRHLKGVVAHNGNAKIISSNDTSNYTYRGRLLNDNEACSMGYIASQKAHNALKWIVANEGINFSGRVCVCWNPSGIAIPKIDIPIVIADDSKPSPTEYKKVLQEKVLGYNRTLPNKEGVVVAMFDAATTGRLSVTYYNELVGSDFINRLASWDEATSFPSSYYGVYSPRLAEFVNMAYGTYRGAYFDTDDKIYRQHMQRLIACRVDNRRMPQDIVRRLVANSSKLQLYNKSTRDKMLHTTCAAIKKRYNDINKEEWPMALEKEKNDRSYQYGRLLAVLEKMESDTYSASETKRETNAIRSQHMFVNRPQTGFAWIMGKLQQSYLRKLPEKARVYYDKLIQEIVAVISECDEDANKPLTETYLMGYYLQKQAFYAKKNNTDSTTNEE